MLTRLGLLASNVFLFACVASSASAQLTGGTAPGGFTTTGPVSDLTFWVRGDAGITKDGANRVSAWADQSGHAANLAQGTLGLQPTQTTTLNGIPIVNFSGGASTQQFMGSIANVSGQSFFIVTTPLGQSDCCNPVVGDSTTFMSTRYDTGNFWRNPGDVNDIVNPAGSEFRINGGVQGGNPAIAQGTAHYLSLERGSGAHNFTSFQLARHNGFATRSYNGNIGEVAVFNRLLNQAEETIVDNHYSSKFNLTMGAHGGAGAVDRYDGDTLANGHRDFSVFGIGQATDGSNVTNAGADGFGFQVAAGLSNDEFVLAGHDGLANSLVAFGGGTGQQWSREWFVDFNASDLSLNLAFDFSDAGLAPPAPGTFQLLSSTDGVNFSIVRNDGVLAGDRVTFGAFNTLGQTDRFFTLGVGASVFVPEPASLAGWLVAATSLAAVAAIRRRARKARKHRPMEQS